MAMTLVGLALAVAIFAGAAYLERRPKEDGRPRWTPYIAIQMIALVGIVLACAHLVTLLTGTHFVGRFSG
ncbi:MAG: hypothetical protein OXT06_01015 [Rhodospirillaceae bacterium]|nr:hypothetical protein [Rhodospirillaceae bacterium]MDD9918175.1 hypothetical protein [Rhodospirillaceae bacterium]MDD9927859.1 hypothetical protein [Rhodospirillaceae bacterium]